jgi:mannose-1-phosphate guanylyltransferase
VSQRNDQQTAVIGKGIHTYNSSGSLIFSGTGRVVITNGVENLVIVDSDDVLLVMSKDREQELRNIVNDMRDKYKGGLT